MESIYRSDVFRSIHEIGEGHYKMGTTNLRWVLHLDRDCLTREAWRAVKKWRRTASRKECAPDYLHSIGLFDFDGGGIMPPATRNDDRCGFRRKWCTSSSEQVLSKIVHAYECA